MSDAPEKQPDRYTVLTVMNNNDLPAYISAAHQLGLTWFAQRGYGGTTTLHIFFDQAGQQAYLAGKYVQVTDEIRTLLDAYHDQAATAEDTLARIRDALK